MRATRRAGRGGIEPKPEAARLIEDSPHTNKREEGAGRRRMNAAAPPEVLDHDDPLAARPPEVHRPANDSTHIDRPDKTTAPTTRRQKQAPTTKSAHRNEDCKPKEH